MQLVACGVPCYEVWLGQAWAKGGRPTGRRAKRGRGLLWLYVGLLGLDYVSPSELREGVCTPEGSALELQLEG